MAKSELIVIDNKNNLAVTQANNLIEANYSTGLTARAHKVQKLIISYVNPKNQNLRVFPVKVDNLKKYLGIKPNTRWNSFYKELKEISRQLRNEIIEIETINGEIIEAVFLSGFKYARKDGIVEFEISGYLTPFLLELKKNFTTYSLVHIPKLRSKYSIRLYELLYQYKKIGKRYLEIGDLQKKVGSSYKLYGDFKRNVLLQSQGDLKKNTNITFIFNEVKTGRKVTAVEFIIFGNTPEEKKSPQLSFLEDAIEITDKADKPAFSEKIIETLNKLGISEQNIAKYLAKGFDIIKDPKKKEEVIKRCSTLENYYLEKLELLKNSPSAQSKSNAAGFLVQALREDWTSSAALKKQQEKKYIEERSKAEKKYRRLIKETENISKQEDSLKEEIIKKLIVDKQLLEDAYTMAMKGLGDFMKKHIKSMDGINIFSLPIEKQYNKSHNINLYTNFKIRTLRPENFIEVDKLETQKAKLETEVEQLKNEYRF